VGASPLEVQSQGRGRQGRPHRRFRDGDPDLRGGAAGAVVPDPQEFVALIEERTRTFVGREYVFAAIDEALADHEFRSGYVVIQGEPGIGKTAIVGQLVKSRGLVHHFNVAPLGIRSPQVFLSTVCAQLIARTDSTTRACLRRRRRTAGFSPDSSRSDKAEREFGSSPERALRTGLDTGGHPCGNR
jgi:AAA ATPase domain